MPVSSPRSIGRVQVVSVSISAALACIWLVPASAAAQGPPPPKPSHWGIIASVSPTAAANDNYRELVYDFEGSGSVKSSEFTIGFVRGSTRGGDWGEQAREFCPSSGYPIDYVLARLFELGLTPDDVRHLERLSDGRVLRALDVSELRYTRREDVVAYMRAWAELLEAQLPVEYCEAAE